MDVIAWAGVFLEQNKYTGTRENSDEHFASVSC